MRPLGSSYFLLSFAARFPFAMLIIGSLTVVVAARESVTLGGYNAAVLGIGHASFAGVIGALADRFGQRRVVLSATIVNTLAMLNLAVLAYSSAPDWLLLIGAFVLGASAPCVGPLSRTRTAAATPNLHDRNRAFATEAMLDEISFVFGPLVVGMLATAFSAATPLVVAAALTIVLCTAFALHSSANTVTAVTQATAPAAPLSHLLHRPVLTTALGLLAIGFCFGSTLVSLTALMQLSGEESQAGIWYSLMGVGSAVCAWLVGRLPAHISQNLRWLVAGVIVIAGAVLYSVTPTGFGLAAAMLLIGVGVGPALVTIYSLASLRSPAGRAATVMTVLGAALTLGQSVSSALTGFAADRWGVELALHLPLAAGGLMLLIAVWDALAERARRARQIPTTRV
ncbi:MFS transporter [Canibacter zhoujuaniae]|uniref:MFS transporter n=1 Tax=Canibacter zhoujuaniae TaxID=2708343 RepID=UPI00142347F7|nr:MFS transporter [Canibacter zhoujuaniae]